MTVSLLPSINQVSTFVFVHRIFISGEKMSSCGCGSSCKCSGGCSGGCKKSPDLTEKSTTSETVILEVAPPKGHSEGSDMAATECRSEGCNCSPCRCSPCRC